MPVFSVKDAIRQSIFCVAVEDGHRSLSEDRSLVHLGTHQMHSAASDA